MEGLAAAASFIAVIQIAKEVAVLCGEYIRDVQHAPQDIQRVQSKAAALQDVLQRLRDDTNSSVDKEAVLKCYNELSDIKSKLELKKRHGTMKRLGLRALKWPFAKQDVEAIIGRMDSWLLVFTTSLQFDINEKVTSAELDRYLERLRYVEDAPFNSYVNDQRHRSCLKETRVDILKQIDNWATSTSSQCIFWLKGLAGMGKSTIAFTVAMGLQQRSKPFASYFLKRGQGDLAHVRGLIPTVVWQLSQHSARFANLIAATIKESPDIGKSMSINEQYGKLLIEPLRKLQAMALKEAPFFIIIDAMDECEQQDDLRLLLRLLTMTDDMPTLGLRLLVTSRPELSIRLGFKEMPSIFYCNLALHDVPRAVVDKDIAIFLAHEMRLIQQRYHLPHEWPLPSELSTLLAKAAGLFIFAATACRYIGGSQLVRPRERLKQICNSVAGNQLITEELDQMYTIILQDYIKGKYTAEEIQDITSRFRTVLGRILLSFRPLSIVGLSTLLSSSRSETHDELEHLLQPLHALLIVPESCHGPVQPLHLSFRDFLVNQDRCLDSRFLLEETTIHRELFLECIRLLSKSLRRNICELPSASTLRSEVSEQRLDDALPEGLQYACQYWVYHFDKGGFASLESDNVYDFLSESFLQWLEAMSLMAMISEAMTAVRQLLDVIEDRRECEAENAGHRPNASSPLGKFVDDCYRFIVTFRPVIEATPGQIYVSALIFSPLNSYVREAFESMAPQWLKRSPSADRNWTSSLQTFECGYVVEEVKLYSKNNMLATSGFQSETDAQSLDFWDPRTGDRKYYINKPIQQATLEYLSPDGRLVASVKKPNSVHIWDIEENECLLAFEEKSGCIGRASFSPNSRLIALEFVNAATKLVDAQNGQVISSLDDHSIIPSLDDHTIPGYGFGPLSAFSPDCKWFASKYEVWQGKYTGLWSVQTGKQYTTFTDHFGSSMAFSHGSKYLALGFHGAVKIWDLSNNAYRHSLQTSSSWNIILRFSPDDLILASGSWNGPSAFVRLWDVQTGHCLSTLDANTMAFSPNCSMLAVGNQQGLVRILELPPFEQLSVFKGHVSNIETLCFSPDSLLLASGSSDKTARLWDVQKGDADEDLDEQSINGKVYQVLYSPNNEFVACSSLQPSRVTIWDPTSGQVRKVLEGKDASFSSDSRFLLIVTIDSTVQVLDLRSWEFRLDVKGVCRPIFSPDSQRVASSNGDRSTITVWDIPTEKEHVVLRSHLKWVDGLVFSEAKPLLAVHGDHTVELWNVQTGDHLHSFVTHSLVQTISFSPNGDVLASIDHSANGLKLWDTRTGHCQFALAGSSRARIKIDIRFSPDSQFVTTYFSDSNVRLWNVHTGKQLLEVPYTSHEPRIEFRTDIGLFFVDRIPYTIGSANVSDTAIAKASRHISTLQIDKPGVWVTRRSENLLWLPLEHRLGAYAVCGNQIVIGSSSGRVLFLWFDEDLNSDAEAVEESQEK